MNSRSNLNKVSNVYVLKEDFTTDREFHSKVRGRNNLKKMLKKLAGLEWIKGDVSVDGEIHRLTSVQRQEWEQEKYCSVLGNRDVIVFGLVKKENDLVVECRCYKEDCRHFSRCRPGFKPEAKPKVKIAEVIEPESFSRPSFIPLTPIEIPAPISDNTIDIVEQLKQENIINFDEEPEIVPLTDIIEPIIPEPEDFIEGQEAIITGLPGEKTLVIAGPGTGKTYSLLKKLEYLVDEEGIIVAENILLLCFTNAAVKEIRNRFYIRAQEEGFSDDLSRIQIRTFDSVATRMLIQRGVDVTGADYDTRIKMAIDELKSDSSILEGMDHFIVDEIQDLIGIRAKFVQAILDCSHEECGFTLLGDPLQGIYDYQMKDQPGELDAKALRHWIEEQYIEELKKVKIRGNKRQNSQLNLFSQKARILLETGRIENITEFIDEVNRIKSCGREHNFNIPDEGRVAVLCRNNGEVLKISGYLRQRGIEHVVRRKRKSTVIPSWVAKLLQITEENITPEILDKIAEEHQLWDSTETDSIFNLLTDLSEGNGRFLNLIKIKQLLASGARLADEVYEQDSRIYVSTIHQSKGREYDSVLLLHPRLRAADEDPFEEAKVYYVAITRAKEKLETIDKSSSRTWFKNSVRNGRITERSHRKGGGHSLLGIEIGVERDVDEQSFVDKNLFEDPIENQRYIKEKVKPGDKLVLKRDGESKRCLIYHKERVIGSTSDFFWHEFDQVYHEVYRKPQYYPLGFEELFVESVYSIIKKPETIRTSIPEPYFNKGVWYGVSILGLGKLRWENDN